MQYFSTGEKPILGEIRAGLFATAPAGWLILDGSKFDETKYPRLYELLGTNTLPNMSAATLSGKGAPYPTDLSPEEEAAINPLYYADCDEGDLGVVVGANGQLVPKHVHGIAYVATNGNTNSVIMNTSSSTDSGFGISASSANGSALFTTEKSTFSDKTYTDVRGKRLLVNFIIRAV